MAGTQGYTQQDEQSAKQADSHTSSKLARQGGRHVGSQKKKRDRQEGRQLDIQTGRH
jgi:hypothetical protein